MTDRPPPSVVSIATQSPTAGNSRSLAVPRAAFGRSTRQCLAVLTMDVVNLALLGEDSTGAQAGVDQRLELHRPGRAPAQRFQVIQGDLLFSPATCIPVSDTGHPVKVHGGHIAAASPVSALTYFARPPRPQASPFFALPAGVSLSDVTVRTVNALIGIPGKINRDEINRNSISLSMNLDA